MDRLKIALFTTIIAILAYLTTCALPSPKSCFPNPCGYGHCTVKENRRYKNGTKRYKAVCSCPAGYTGYGCRWPCNDVYKSCKNMWKEENRCRIHKQWTDWYDINCADTCGACQYDKITVPKHPPFPPILEPLEFLMGRWVMHSTDHKKWPVHFTWGSNFQEEMKFEVTDVPMFGTPCLNYTSIAVNKRDSSDVQIERGFISVQDRYNKYPVTIALMRTTNNGAIFWEEGVVELNKQVFKMKLTRVNTLEQLIDGYDMTYKFPQEANRTLTVISQDSIRIQVDEVRDGRRETYYMTYYKQRDF